MWICNDFILWVYSLEIMKKPPTHCSLKSMIFLLALLGSPAITVINSVYVIICPVFWKWIDFCTCFFLPVFEEMEFYMWETNEVLDFCFFCSEIEYHIVILYFPSCSTMWKCETLLSLLTHLPGLCSPLAQSKLDGVGAWSGHIIKVSLGQKESNCLLVY